jgi:glycine dehydrogenase subunit 1
MGPQGMHEVATSCLRKSRYTASRLMESGRFELAFDRPTFKEFVLRDKQGDVEGFLRDALAAGFFAGIPLGRWYPELRDCLLVTVTEKRTKEEIDKFAERLANPQVATPK